MLPSKTTINNVMVQCTKMEAIWTKATDWEGDPDYRGIQRRSCRVGFGRFIWS